jgi:hypothetical protein
MEKMLSILVERVDNRRGEPPLFRSDHSEAHKGEDNGMVHDRT